MPHRGIEVNPDEQDLENINYVIFSLALKFITIWPVYRNLAIHLMPSVSACLACRFVL